MARFMEWAEGQQVDDMKLGGTAKPGSPTEIDRSTFKEAPKREEQEKSKYSAKRQLVWKLLRNKKFIKELGEKNPEMANLTSQELYDLANDLMKNNTPEEIEQALMNLQAGKEALPLQFKITPQEPVMGSPPASLDRLKKAIEIAVDAAVSGKTGEAGNGGRTAAANLALQLFKLPDDEVTNIWNQTKQFPGKTDVSVYLPESVAPKSTSPPKRQLPNELTLEDFRAFARGQRGEGME
jgi:hypothetical protein